MPEWDEEQQENPFISDKDSLAGNRRFLIIGCGQQNRPMGMP